MLYFDDFIEWLTGLFLVIGVGVALGVTIGIILLFATLLLFRRSDYCPEIIIIMFQLKLIFIKIN